MDLEDLDDEQQVIDAKRAEQQEDLRWFIADERGRRIIRRLLAQTAPFATSFNTEASLMALAEGRKQLGYFLLAELTAAAPNETAMLLTREEG